MFGRIAGVYDLLNHTLSLGIDKSWRRKLADLVKPQNNELALDLAAGTLDVALALQKKAPEAAIVAIDFCQPMLKQGAAKLKNANTHILPCAGDALALPVRDGVAQCVTMAFGIRNIPDRIKSFQEMWRVLKPGGIAGILEFGSGKEKIWGGIYNFYLNRLLPAIGKAVAKDQTAYEYLAQTIREFPPAPVLAAEMQKAGFEKTGYEKLTSGIVCLHWGIKPA